MSPIGLHATARERYLAARNGVMVALAGLAIVALCTPFVSILVSMVRRAGSFAVDGASVRATLIAALLASAAAVPVGVGAGVYLAEFGVGRFGRAVRAAADVVGGMPAIVIAAVVYVLVHRGATSVGVGAASVGVGAALAIMMVPRVARTTDEAVRAVPGNLREAALCLGVSRFRTVLFVMLRTASPRIARSVVVAVARVIGEAAPVLVLGASHGLRDAETLPARVAQLGASPAGWGTAAWLLGVVVSLSLLARAR